MDNIKDKHSTPEKPQKPPRKNVQFINVSEAGTTERKVKISYKHPEKFDNIEKIVFKCQPKSNDPNHNSLDTISRNTPVLEIVYRLITNNRGQMKLGDITNRTMEILKSRKLAKIPEDESICIYFYRLLKENKSYSFGEVE